MRSRRPRFQRLKFRDFDARARDALRVMLNRLPVEVGAAEPVQSGGAEPVRAAGAEPLEAAGEDVDAGGREGGVEWLLAEIQRLVAAEGPLGSPLSFYSVQQIESELVLICVRAVEQPYTEDLPRWEERPLGRVRRPEKSVYQLRLQWN